MGDLETIVAIREALSLRERVGVRVVCRKQPAMINSAFGLLLIAAGTPIYLLY